MNRRIGLAPARVERQLARVADALAERNGVRPTPPPQHHSVDGEPFWDVDDDTAVYAMRDGDNLVWRWETGDVDTLVFWATRDMTFRLAGDWEAATRPPGHEFRWQATRERWAWLMGVADERWRVRHLAWLESSDRSGFIGWPTPPAVLIVIERLAQRLAEQVDQPHPPLPLLAPNPDARPWIETHGDEFRYRVRSGERDIRDDRTTDIGDLLFWVFEPLTREMARAATSGDWRGRWLELMVLVNPGWRGRVERYL